MCQVFARAHLPCTLWHVSCHCQAPPQPPQLLVSASPSAPASAPASLPASASAIAVDFQVLESFVSADSPITQWDDSVLDVLGEIQSVPPRTQWDDSVLDRMRAIQSAPAPTHPREALGLGPPVAVAVADVADISRPSTTINAPAAPVTTPMPPPILPIATATFGSIETVQTVPVSSAAATALARGPQLPRPQSIFTDLLVFGRSSVLSRPWWHEMVPQGLMMRVMASAEIVWRLPADQLDERGMLQHALAVVRRVSQDRHGPRQHYIGITERPDERWAEHAQNGYSMMYIIVIADTSLVTAAIETALISFCRRSIYCQNVGAGGERASRGHPHFAYIVTRPDGLLRRSSGGSSSARVRGGMTTVEADLQLWGGYGPR